MSDEERKRIEVMARVKKGDLRLRDAAEILGISYRQAKRIRKRYGKQAIARWHAAPRRRQTRSRRCEAPASGPCRTETATAGRCAADAAVAFRRIRAIGPRARRRLVSRDDRQRDRARSAQDSQSHFPERRLWPMYGQPTRRTEQPRVLRVWRYCAVV